MSSDSHREFDDDITEDYHDCDADLEGDDGSMISMSNAQRAYLESNNSKKQLFLMCFGLTDEGGIPVFDLDTEPWNAIKKRDIKPARVEYASEIIRRSNSMSTAANRAPTSRTTSLQTGVLQSACNGFKCTPSLTKKRSHS